MTKQDRLYGKDPAIEMYETMKRENERLRETLRKADWLFGNISHEFSLPTHNHAIDECRKDIAYALSNKDSGEK